MSSLANGPRRYRFVTAATSSTGIGPFAYRLVFEYCALSLPKSRRHVAQAPVRQTRAEKKADTRERLLAAAEAIAVNEGFGRITLEAVATAAGLTKGAIYSNFESKEELLIEVVVRV